ncbi:MAG: site-specific integrase, partial [Gemmatimonadota bacterium]
MTDDLSRAFLLEPFRDHLSLEAGHSVNTVDNYLRDLARMAQYANGLGAAGPGELTSAQLRDFIFTLKDLGLSPATIRRQVSAVHTYYRFLLGEGLVKADPSERLQTPRRGRQLPGT